MKGNASTSIVPSLRILPLLVACLWLACGGKGGLTADGAAGSGGATRASDGTGGAAGAGGGAGANGEAGAGGGSGGASGGDADGASGARGDSGDDSGVDGDASGDDAGAADAVDSSADDGGEGGIVPIPNGGCNRQPAPNDSWTNYVEKIVQVAGVDPAFAAAHPPTNTTFTWTTRNYWVRLPVGYSPDKAFPVDLEGTGCGGNDTTGRGGDYALPATRGQTEAIQVGLSYLPANSVDTCAMFADDFTNSPEPGYLRAVIADVEARFCVDDSRVFINGYSQGASESILAGCTNADQIRAYGVQIGGLLRINHPDCGALPTAAMFVVGLNDLADPIGPLATPQQNSFGSQGARDEQLLRNGCVPSDFKFMDTCPALPNGPACAAGTATGDTYGNAPHHTWNPKYPKCQTYSGCPAAFPVVWCPLDVNHGNGPHPMGTDADPILAMYRFEGLWDFYMSLPPR